MATSSISCSVSVAVNSPAVFADIKFASTNNPGAYLNRDDYPDECPFLVSIVSAPFKLAAVSGLICEGCRESLSLHELLHGLGSSNYANVLMLITGYNLAEILQCDCPACELFGFDALRASYPQYPNFEPVLAYKFSSFVVWPCGDFDHPIFMEGSAVDIDVLNKVRDIVIDTRAVFDFEKLFLE